MSDDQDSTIRTAAIPGVSQDLAMLLERALPHIKTELAGIGASIHPPEAFVVLVMDGTSSLVGFAPAAKAEQMRHGGATHWVAQRVARAALQRFCEVYEPAIAARLAAPPACGHVQFVASIAGGAFLRCTACDLDMAQPTRGAAS